MEELIPKALLDKHGLSGLPERRLRDLRERVLAVAGNRYAAKLLGVLTRAEVAELERAPEAERQLRLAAIAKAKGLDVWVRNEIEIAIIEIARHTTSTH
jgi:hypothetical protein